jgi:type II secretory pathway pseudopilin PulG
MKIRDRSAFTIVELLVVMGILMFLFGLGVAMLPSVYQKVESAKGAEILQGAFARARQEARRSGRPSGVRLFPDPPNNVYVSSLQFVQEPVDLTGGVLTGAGVNVTVNPNPDPANTVGVGDYLQINGCGVPHQIAGGAGGAWTLASPLANPIVTGTPQYRIMRKPLPLQGERATIFPVNTGIDVTYCSTDGLTQTGLPISGNLAGAPYLDVMFAPNGNLTGLLLGTDKIIFWVRDISQGDSLKGYPTCIVIYGATGLIAAHPADIKNAAQDYYFFCRRPNPSGL